MIREVTFANSKKTRYRGLQLIVNPNTTHRIVDSRVNHHWLIVLHTIDFVSEIARINISDFLIHIEEVAITLLHSIKTQAVDTLGKVEEYSQTCVIYAKALITTLLSCTASNITRNEVTECRIATLQIVVTVFFWDFPTFLSSSLQSLSIFNLLWNPDTSIVTERL